jgi:hypothetical protein
MQVHCGVGHYAEHKIVVAGNFKGGIEQAVLCIHFFAEEKRGVWRHPAVAHVFEVERFALPGADDFVLGVGKNEVAVNAVVGFGNELHYAVFCGFYYFQRVISGGTIDNDVLDVFTGLAVYRCQATGYVGGAVVSGCDD